MLKNFIFTFFLVVVFHSAQSQQAAATLPPGLEAYINKVISTMEIPGLSVSIVKDGKVLLANGFGVRKLGSPEKVDAHTLFPIASNTKAFTATALGLLVEDGKIKWDDPVIDYLPWFKMSDPFVTFNMTVRDLLVHRSGLAAYAGDLLQFPPTDYTRREIVEKLRYLPLVTSFRSAYAYDNILYLAAAELIKNVTGQEWEDFVRTRILDKAGMNESISRFSQLKTKPNFAYSHARVNDKVQVLENFFAQGFSDFSDPAGGIATNSVDMAKWLIVQLDSGVAANGNRLFRQSTTNELWKAVTPMPFGKIADVLKPAQMDFLGYALGFNVYNYRHMKAIAHGGKLDGYVSRVVMIPGLRLGVAILSNQEAGGGNVAVINHILDHFMQVPQYNWLDAYRKLSDDARASLAKKKSETAARRTADAKPVLPLSDYMGTYTDKWYGDVKISMENSKPVIRFTRSAELVGDMEHWQYNTFVVKWRNRELRADAYITFNMNGEGKIDEVKMKAISEETDPSYDFHDLLLKKIK